MAHEGKHDHNIEQPHKSTLFVQKLAADIAAGAISAFLITPPVALIDQ